MSIEGIPWTLCTGCGPDEDRAFLRWSERVWTRLCETPDAMRQIDELGGRQVERLAWDAFCDRMQPARFVRSLAALGRRGGRP